MELTDNNLTIDQMRVIVSGIPDETATHVAVCRSNHYYRLDKGYEQTCWDNKFNGWMDSSIEESWEFFYNFKLAYVLKDLRTIIAEHDNRSFKVGDWVVLNIGSRVYKVDHIHDRKVWLDSGKPQLDIVSIDDVLRHATSEEIKAGFCIDKQLVSGDRNLV